MICVIHCTFYLKTDSCFYNKMAEHPLLLCAPLVQPDAKYFISRYRVEIGKTCTLLKDGKKERSMSDKSIRHHLISNQFINSVGWEVSTFIVQTSYFNLVYNTGRRRNWPVDLYVLLTMQ
jgi:hypothetical protein